MFILAGVEMSLKESLAANITLQSAQGKFRVEV